LRYEKLKLEKFLREKNIFFYPSGANFLLLKVAQPDKIIEGLKLKRILVRPKSAPDGQKAVRVSIGRVKDTERFITTFDKLLS
jgi:histidinol-phosphate/aromatic aminotransferase/cobyric acid decarboxylase-like protein